MTTDVITRFAPSPTGLMHFGNLRTALFNYLFAMRYGGVFNLRIEDTDVERSTKQHCDSLLHDLKIFGLEYSSTDYQSQRGAVYNKYYDALEKTGAAYPCFCSEEKLAKTRKLQLASGQAPRYPGTCSSLTATEILMKKDQGLLPSLRFKVPRDLTVEFNDLLKGPQKFLSNDIGDFIIRRATGAGSFMFCNAIDDSLLGTTHAFRGEDHLTNTPRQIMILQQLGMRIPSYGHFPMILGIDGTVLSKRNGSAAVQDLCNAGYSIDAINNYLARLGHKYQENTLFSLEQLSKKFSLANISKSAARYDPDQLRFWQKEFINNSSVEKILLLIKPHVTNIVSADKMLQFTKTIADNIVMPEDAVFWANTLLATKLQYSDDAKKILQETDTEFFTTAAKLINNTSIEFSDFMNALKQNTEYRGKKLFQPLRAAITTVLHGPELKNVAALIGWNEVQKRLEYAANI